MANPQTSTQAAPDKKTTGADDAEWLGLFVFLMHFVSQFPRSSTRSRVHQNLPVSLDDFNDKGNL